MRLHPACKCIWQQGKQILGQRILHDVEKICLTANLPACVLCVSVHISAIDGVYGLNCC